VAFGVVFYVKYGGWFNVVEVEFAVLLVQCLGGRCVFDVGVLNLVLSIWYSWRILVQKGVDWYFTTKDARIKLKSLCPVIM